MEVSRDEIAGRLDDPTLTVLDVRSATEFDGSGYRCCARQGHIPGARNVDVVDLLGRPASVVRDLLGVPEGSEIAVYCHSGNRSALAAEVLRAAGYDARNYAGSWHEWAAEPALPAE
ncbi:MAG: hypothetical protein ICV64_02745 [Thermoleophilia bacterium]|nr:hypothetical protein [Thermoleophilia bacterium]